MVYNQIYSYFWLLDNRVPSSCSFIKKKASQAEPHLELQILVCISPSCGSLNPWKHRTVPPVSVIPPSFLLDLMCH